ncbi:MAG TPA: protein kinase [Blastocatellia bacterium]|nr:protein kinase [Blastocatellia bacterium]
MKTTLKNRPRLPVDFAVEPDTSAPLANPELARAAKGIYNSAHNAIHLGEKIGGGGEGTVYRIAGQDDLVAKIYHEPPSREKAEKLIALAQLGNERLYKMAAWPVDVLRDRPEGNVIGFVMKRIGHAAEVHTLHSPKSRLQKFPEASWAFLLHVAANIARAVATMHEHGFVIGDVNPKNILVTRQATVYLLDCDSFQFVAEGKTYRCGGGFPEYTPPELQGIPFAEVDRTQEHDCFGLAVVLFQLLFLGRHPFSGRFLGAGEMPLEQAIREGRFAYGEDAATRNMQPPPGTLSLAAISVELRGLFRRAFLETDRPNPVEWLSPLERFSQDLQACALHNGHHYSSELKSCPWCELEARVGVRLFNLKLGNRQSEFRLAELWAEIESLEQFQPLPQRTSSVVPEPSAAALEYARIRDVRYRLALGFAAVMGGVIAWLTDLPAAFLFMVFTGSFAQLLARMQNGDSIKLDALLPNRWRVPAAIDLSQLRVTRENARDRLRQLEQQLWGNKNGEQKYIDQLNQLKTWQHEYVTLEQQHAIKLKRRAFNAALSKYLQKFLIKDSGVVSASMANWMHGKGIVTAADIHEQRLRKKGVVNEYHLQKLVEWRQQLEAQFNFDTAFSLVPETFAEARKELEAQRQRLEDELTARTHQLRNVKQQLEARRHQLLPTWTETRQTLSQAERDFEEVVKENRTAPVMVTMVAVFLLFSFFEGVSMVEPPAVSRTAPAPMSTQNALNYHLTQGLLQLQREEQFQALESFTNAVALVDLSKWEHRYASLFHSLCVTYQMQNQVDWYIKSAEGEVASGLYDDKSRVKLVILYTMKGRNAQAIKHYRSLRDHWPVVSESLNREMITHGVDLEALNAKLP